MTPNWGEDRNTRAERDRWHGVVLKPGWRRHRPPASLRGQTLRLAGRSCVPALTCSPFPKRRGPFFPEDLPETVNDTTVCCLAGTSSHLQSCLDDISRGHQRSSRHTLQERHSTLWRTAILWTAKSRICNLTTWGEAKLQSWCLGANGKKGLRVAYYLLQYDQQNHFVFFLNEENHYALHESEGEMQQCQYNSKWSLSVLIILPAFFFLNKMYYHT